MTPDPSVTSIWQVVSRREARLVSWLVVALVAVIATVMADSLSVMAAPAIILFVVWLMAYVLEPPVSWLQRHLPFRGRGIAVAITYFVTAVVAIAVIGAASIAVLNAAVDMSPVAVFVVVILGTSVAGIMGAVFAIPTAAAILAVTDYLRRRDMLLRSVDEDGDADGDAVDSVPGDIATQPTSGSGVS
jgi:predicted PurR-regulated permease PerM